MKTPVRALLLAALILLPLVPTAQAVGPETRWPAYNAGSDVNAIVIAREGRTIAAALAAPPYTTGGTAPTISCAATPSGLPTQPTPACARTDLIVLDHDHGYAQNLTYYDITKTPPTLPPGRSLVAVSRDGTAIASVGPEYQQTTNANRTRLYYSSIPAGGNWSTPGSFNRSIDLGSADAQSGGFVPDIVGLALSDDGRRVAVLYGFGDQYALRGWTFTGGSLNGAMNLSAPGIPRALAASGDLSRMIVAGQFPQGNLSYGGAHVLPFAQGTPLATWFETSANNTDTRSAASSRDGTVVAVSDVLGKVYVFHDATLQAPTVANATAQPANLSMSEDGSRLAAFATKSLVVLDTTSGATPLWNTTSGAQSISGVALSGTGGVVLVGGAGTGGAVVAYGEDDARPLWQIPGDTRAVAIDSAATRIAYAQRASIGAASVPHTLTMELAGGGRVSAQRIVTSPGNTSFEVTLRNDGGAAERVVFEESAPGVSIASAAPFIVRPGDVLRTNVTITIEAGLVGPRVFNVSARSLGSNAIDNVTLAIAPAPTLDVRLLVDSTDVIAQLGRTTESLLTIVNNGTGDANVTVRATQSVSGGVLWNLSLSEPSVTALRGTRTSVKVLMTPPANAENGTSASVDFTLEGPGIFDTARVVYRINPSLAVEVNATGVTKFISPGERAFYNVTVTNTGSLPRQFELFYTIASSDGRNWGVDMQTQTTRLEPLERRVMPVVIVAPADAQPDERVAVVVSARSLPETVNETLVTDNVTLYGIAVAPKVTSTTPVGNGVPGFVPLAAIAAFALVALLRRRPT